MHGKPSFQDGFAENESDASTHGARIKVFAQSEAWINSNLAAGI